MSAVALRVAHLKDRFRSSRIALYYFSNKYALVAVKLLPLCNISTPSYATTPQAPTGLPRLSTHTVN